MPQAIFFHRPQIKAVELTFVDDQHPQKTCFPHWKHSLHTYPDHLKNRIFVSKGKHLSAIDLDMRHLLTHVLNTSSREHQWSLQTVASSEQT